MIQRYSSTVHYEGKLIVLESVHLTKKRFIELGKEYGFNVPKRSFMPQAQFGIATKPRTTGKRETVIIWRTLLDPSEWDHNGGWGEWSIFFNFKEFTGWALV